MGRAPCCSKVGLHKGPWTPREDTLLTKYIQAHGEGQWKSLPKKAGLLRCGKSCRLRWMNYLRPDIKRGNITPEEDDLIIRMHSLLGNKWSLIAGRLPGRTDNEIKNYWNTHLSKKVKTPGSDSKYQEQEEGPSSKKKSKNNEGKKKSNNKKQSKREKNKRSNNNNNNNKGSNNDYEEPQKTQVYLPKPIRVKPSSLPRTNSITTFTTFDDSTISGGSTTTRSQEKDQEEFINIVDPTKTKEGRGGGEDQEEQNNMIMVNNSNNNVELLENDDGFGFFCDDYDLVNNSDMECQPYFAADHHGTLEKVYEEYWQLLNMEDNMLELDSFAESLMV